MPKKGAELLPAAEVVVSPPPSEEEGEEGSDSGEVRVAVCVTMAAWADSAALPFEEAEELDEEVAEEGEVAAAASVATTGVEKTVKVKPLFKIQSSARLPLAMQSTRARLTLRPDPPRPRPLPPS